MKKVYWEHFDHQADIGIRGVGTEMAQAFEQAAIALTAVVTESEKVEPIREIQIACQADGDEQLFIDWISSLIYEMSTWGMLFCKFEVSIEADHLRAKVWGQQVDVEIHQPSVEVKGATYTALSVTCDKDGKWIAQCVVDV
ncbi:archease [Planctomycetota bacterium]